MNILFNKKTTGLIDAKFSILIPTWNNLSYLKLCINSIKKNSFFQHQVIVHVNEGKDGTAEWLEEQGDISFCISNENIGVCYALNSCRTMVSTDYIFYLNDDMYVCPNWDKFLYDEIKATPHNLFFFSATAIEPSAQSNCSIKKNYGSDVETFNEAKLLVEYNLPTFNNWQGATWPPNIVHKNIWDLVGGYSTEFSPGMYSDPDFSMKLFKAGVRLFKGLEKSRVYHFGSKSVKRVKRNNGYYTFIAKWGFTSSTFSKYYLQRGELFSGAIAIKKVPLAIIIKNIFKQLVAIFKRT